MNDHTDEGELSTRQLARRDRIQSGRRSAALAHTLLKLSKAQLKLLVVDEALRAAITRAHDVTSLGPRRREERRLAGELRRIDPTDLEEQLLAIEDKRGADARLFKNAEVWRTRMIEEGQPAGTTFCDHYSGLDLARWRQLISEAREEHMVGAPVGAKKSLFSAIVAVLRTPR